MSTQGLFSDQTGVHSLQGVVIFLLPYRWWIALLRIWLDFKMDNSCSMFVSSHSAYQVFSDDAFNPGQTNQEIRGWGGILRR